jgi:uncharacterized DUF497 family protein
MAYTLTEHAHDAMEKRGIAVEWLERTLVAPQRREPDKTDGQLEHRMAAIPEFGNRVLRVIVNTAVEPERVITMYFDRAARRAMRGEL